MIKGNNMAKLLMLVIGALLYNSSPALSKDDVQTEVTDGNGNTEKINDFYVPSTSGSSGGSSPSVNVNIPDITGGDTGTGTGTETADTATACGQDNKECSNLYRDRPLFPQAMMIYCQVSAKKIAEDLSLIEECIKKYVKAMNNDNAEIKHQGMQDFNVLRSQTLRDTLTLATDKLKSVINYNDIQNDYSTATSRSNTQRDTEAALTHAHSFATDMINNLRELYAENLKFMAINGIGSIDPAAILNKEEYEASKTTVKKSSSTETENAGVKADTKITPSEGASDVDSSDWGSHDWSLDELGTEEPAGGSSSGSSSNSGEINLDIDDEGSYTLPEVVITGHVSLNDYEKMTPEEFAQHKEEFNELRKELNKALNDPDASDTEIANAERALERMDEIEAKMKK